MALEYAPIWTKQDKTVLQTKKQFTSLEIAKFSNDEVITYISQKDPILDANNNVVGIYCIGIKLPPLFLSQLNAMFAVCSDKEIKQNKYMVYNIVQNYNKKLDLTQRQEECLYWMLRGKTAKEMGGLLDLSPRTVEQYMEQIKSKFNCCSKNQLIEKCLYQGYFYNIPESLFSYAICADNTLTKQTLRVEI